jgi:16S rRNA (cytosine1402-N4)-methyltransferase
MEVNGEMRALERLLIHAAECIKPNGRMVVISYHSLEDRMVKNFFNSGNFTGQKETDLYGNIQRPFHPSPAKAIIPTDAEIALNRRARSAKMRIAVRN